MNKNDAKKQIQKLRDEINYHNYQYYVENNPVISDYQYDMLLKKLEALILSPLIPRHNGLEENH
jgi:DNA ligase (NAD+)